ncbi:YadA-like family protein [uncultured Desulfuromonas sp.]|uniref:YadA-like family protein n=1 Tax=uncultured Desulfuromonas sp. TaxID=181013 RepID=UPI002AAB326A|nr:YadA-like family protein [uncultured Desulfuromonas sp.]
MNTWRNKIFTLAVTLLVSGAAIPAHADQVINDNLIVDGSVCIGNDCDNGAAFGDTTLLFRENNLRILFEDTSLPDGIDSGRYPATDWQITINDSEAGGSNYFGVDNVTNYRSALRIYEGLDAAVVIGEGATSSGDNTLSIGTSGHERRITNVADGEDATDAATYGQLTTVQSQVTTNATSISTNADNISQNSSDIVTNSADIATNATSISTNADNISQNSSDIVTNSADIATNASAISNNSAAIAVNTESISANTTSINANSTAINANTSAISTNADNISQNTSDIAAINTTLSSLSATGSDSASASGTDSLALGSGATAYDYDTAIGANATVTADGSTAVGSNTLIESENAVSIGADATVNSEAVGGVALGQNAVVEQGATNAIALGKDSVADEANTVSVGSSDNQRRITNIADGENDGDAVNVSQLNPVKSAVSSNSTAIADEAETRAAADEAQQEAIDNNSQTLARNIQDISDNRSAIVENRRDIKRLSKDVDINRAGIAAVAAMAAIPGPVPGKRNSFGIGYGTFKGEDALALGFKADLTQNLRMTTAVSHSRHDMAANVGLGWSW